jgi:hypothetical protein
MGAIEDVRKVIQDLIAPDLKAIQAQIKGAEEASHLRNDALSAKIDNLSEKMDRKFEIVFAKMEANHASIIYALNIEKRVEAIERKTAAPMQAT